MDRANSRELVMNLHCAGWKAKAFDPCLAGWRTRVQPTRHLPVRMITHVAVDRAIHAWLAAECSRPTVNDNLAILVRVLEQARRDGTVELSRARITGWQRSRQETGQRHWAAGLRRSRRRTVASLASAIFDGVPFAEDAGRCVPGPTPLTSRVGRDHVSAAGSGQLPRLLSAKALAVGVDDRLGRFDWPDWCGRHRSGAAWCHVGRFCTGDCSAAGRGVRQSARS